MKPFLKISHRMKLTDFGVLINISVGRLRKCQSGTFIKQIYSIFFFFSNLAIVKLFCLALTL